MDITPYLELRTAPRIYFDALPEPRTRARFMVPARAGDWRAVTWGAFGDEIRQLTLYLAKVGLRPGDRAVVYGHNSVDWIAAALAIQAAGGVMVPVYPSSTPAQAAYVVQHSDARVVFVDPSLYSRIEGAESGYEGVARLVLLGEDLPASEADAAPVRWRTAPLAEALAAGAARDAEDPAAFEQLLGAVSLEQPGLMLYTSGTSGNPKGVPLTHRNVAQNGGDWLKAVGPLLEDRMTDLLWLPMSHIFGYGEACLGNMLGFTSYLCDPLTVMARLPDVRPDVFMSVPSVWEKLAQAAQAKVREHGEAGNAAAMTARLAEVTGGRLRFCLSGGAGLKREVKELFHQAGVLIIEGYGLTETSPTLTLNRPDAFRFDSVGQALGSVELRLAEDGEILARGPSVFAGYHKDPEATREAFTADGWFQTGDVGRFTEDGFLQIIDRKKDILVTAGGKNVPPANIELRFKDDPLIAHLVVYGEAKRYLVAGVWLNEPEAKRHLEEAGLTGAPARAREAALQSLVQERIDAVNAGLASYESLKRFAILAEPLTLLSGHLTPTMKVRRKKVYETFRDVFEALYATADTATTPGAVATPMKGGADGPKGATEANVAANVGRLLQSRPPRPGVELGASPAEVIHAENKWRLLRYRARPAGLAYPTPLLMVPSLINRHYVLDLMPGKSLVEYLVGRGHDVFLVDWGTPGDEDRFVTFDEVTDRYLGRALRRTTAAAGTSQAHLLGYCLGGTLAMIHAAVHGERVASLTTLAAPVRFDDQGLLATWTRAKGFDVSALTEAFGNAPWPLLQSAFQLLRPTLVLSKLVGVVGKTLTSKTPEEMQDFLDGYLALDTWGNDAVSFPGACYQRYVEELYRGNALIEGRFTLSGRPARLEAITCPTLAVTFEHDNIVPWQSASVLLERVGTPAAAREHIHLAGGHVGAVVSRAAGKILWPRLSDFWARHEPRASRALHRAAPRQSPPAAVPVPEPPRAPAASSAGKARADALRGRAAGPGREDSSKAAAARRPARRTAR